MPKYVRAMPKYALICQNKNCSKISSVLNMPDAVAYVTYLSIFRTLLYPEAVACSENPFKDFSCPCHSEFCITLAYSEFAAYSEPCQISTMKLFCENS